MTETKPVRMYAETEEMIDRLKEQHNKANEKTPHLKLSKPAFIHKVILDEVLRTEEATL